MAGSRGELTQVSGKLDISVYDFFQTKGDFAIEKMTETVTLADGVLNPDGTVKQAASTVKVDLLTLGASKVAAFAGIGGGTDNAMGLSLTGVDFGMALMSEQLTGAPGEAAPRRSNLLGGRAWRQAEHFVRAPRPPPHVELTATHIRN